MTHDLPTIDLVELTVDGVHRLFAGGITAEALARAFLDRIAVLDPGLNAIVVLNPDALEEARASDARRAAGTARGPLDGVPVVVKDTMDMAGLPTTAGWRLLHAGTGGVALMPIRDAPVVARMKAAGCVILGKTNVPVLSHSGSHANDSWAGPTLNAAGRDWLPGGSSAGTATAVAASLAVLGLGEETGGSIQNPASAQALVGLRPTHALVPNTGVMPLSSNRDVVGPIARSVRDAALCLDVLAGYSAEDPKTIAGVGHRPRGGYAAALEGASLQGRRLGLYGAGWRAMPLSGEASRLYDRAKGEWEALGAVLVDDPFADTGFAALRQPTAPPQEFDARGIESVPHDLDDYLRRHEPDAAVKSFADFAAATAAEDPFAPGGVLAYLHAIPSFAACLADPSGPPDLSDFIALKEAYLAMVEAVFADHQLDALLFPQMRGAVPSLRGGDPIQPTSVGEINIAGLPAVILPAGYYDAGQPFGLILIGLRWSEADLLAMASAYERAYPHRRWPDLGDVGGTSSAILQMVGPAD